MPLTLNKIARAAPIACPALVFLATAVLALTLAPTAAAQQVGAMFSPGKPSVELKSGALIVHLKAPTDRIEIGQLTKQQVQAAKKADALPNGWRVQGLGGGRIALEGPVLAPGKKVQIPLKIQAGSIKLRFDFSKNSKSYFEGKLEARRPE